MTDFDSKTVKKVARLARIHVSDEEASALAGELGGILKWVEQLGEIDTDNVEQLSSVSDVALPWRADEVSDGGMQEQVLTNAPKSEYGCFAVPKVIE